MIDMPSCLYMQLFTRKPIFKSKIMKSDGQRPKMRKTNPEVFERKIRIDP